MTKRNITITVGTIILTVAGFLITNAHKTFSSVSTAWAQTVGGTFITLFRDATNSNYTATVKAGCTSFVECGSTKVVVFGTKSTTVKLYCKACL
jgi:hypothetical protein